MPSAMELIRMAMDNRAAQTRVSAKARVPQPRTPPPTASAAKDPLPPVPPAPPPDAKPPAPEPPENIAPATNAHTPPRGRIAMMRTPPGMPKRGSPLTEVMRRHELAARSNISKGGHT